MAFQRHIAENSCPKSILTDNAAEYVRADLELKKIMENQEVKFLDYHYKQLISKPFQIQVCMQNCILHMALDSP